MARSPASGGGAVDAGGGAIHTRVLILFAITFCMALGIYLLTMAPSLTWSHHGADGGDFVTSAVTGRLAHPPGFPVYGLLARLAVRLSLRDFVAQDPAWRLNLLSALMAAGAIGLTAATALRRGQTLWAAAAAALTLAVSPLFWSQALITEVYSTSAFFVAAALWWAAYTESRGGLWVAFVGGLLWGLGCAVHWTLLFLAPLEIVWLFWERGGRPAPEFSRSQLPLREGALFFAGWLAGLAPYALLPLSGPWPQPWGDMRTLAGWWDVVSARLYWGYAFGLPLADWPRRVLSWASLLARQFTPAGALLALWGIRSGWRGRRVETLGALATLALGSVYAIAYNTPDSLVYLVLWMPLLALWLGDGLEAALAWLRRWGRRGVNANTPGVGAWSTPRNWAGLLLPLALACWNWRALDVSHDVAVARWLSQMLAQTPERAVLVAQGDAQTFALWYAQSALELRPDVLVVNGALWQQTPYREFILAQAGLPAARPEDLAQERPLCTLLQDEEVVCR
ncbi:MAG: DUF2723 domain-containing protein [Anaerolineae bacterium]|nr:DUF2723 domain-containing protein [Anaerolineae bacterium]